MAEALNTAALLRDLTRDEGRRLKPYRDSLGLLTIGVGRCLDVTGISEDEADVLLWNDILRVTQGLDEQLPWWRDLSEVRQRAVCNLAFNLGVDGLLKFKNTLAALKAGDYLAAAQGLLASKYARQVGTRAVRLATMLRDGNDFHPEPA